MLFYLIDYHWAKCGQTSVSWAPLTNHVQLRPHCPLCSEFRFLFFYSGNNLFLSVNKVKYPWCYDEVQQRETAAGNHSSTFYTVLPEWDFCLTNGPHNCILNVDLRPSCQDFISFTTAEAICVFLCLEISLYYLILQLGSARVIQVSHLGPNQIVNLHLLRVKCF